MAIKPGESKPEEYMPLSILFFYHFFFLSALFLCNFTIFFPRFAKTIISFSPWTQNIFLSLLLRFQTCIVSVNVHVRAWKGYFCNHFPKSKGRRRDGSELSQFVKIVGNGGKRVFEKKHEKGRFFYIKTIDSSPLLLSRTLIRVLGKFWTQRDRFYLQWSDFRFLK